VSAVAIPLIPWGMLLAAVGIYAACILALLAAGRRTGARALAGFVPDCAVMFRRLLARPDTTWWERAGLVVLVAYLVSPLDIVPDFVPIAGQLDDAVIVVLALRLVLRRHGEAAVRSAWPGPESSLRVILRLGGGKAPDEGSEEHVPGVAPQTRHSPGARRRVSS
jgi:uncharacterized membrane protein YkvA (DUF1232 family)